MNRFEDKSVVVTGAASGFGVAITRKFAAEGANVLLADIDLGGAERVASELPSAVAIRVDVADEQDNIAMVQAAVDNLSLIHI